MWHKNLDLGSGFPAVQQLARCCDVHALRLVIINVSSVHCAELRCNLVCISAYSVYVMIVKNI